MVLVFLLLAAAHDDDHDDDDDDEGNNMLWFSPYPLPLIGTIISSLIDDIMHPPVVFLIIITTIPLSLPVSTCISGSGSGRRGWWW